MTTIETKLNTLNEEEIKMKTAFLIFQLEMLKELDETDITRIEKILNKMKAILNDQTTAKRTANIQPPQQTLEASFGSDGKPKIIRKKSTVKDGEKK